MIGVALRGADGTVLWVMIRAIMRAAYAIEVKNVTGPGVKARGLESLAISIGWTGLEPLIDDNNNYYNNTISQ